MHTLLVALALASPLPDGLSFDDAVSLEGDVAFAGMVAPQEVPVGGTATIELYYRVPGPLPADVWSFVHVESSSTACRVVADLPLASPRDGVIHHRVEVTFPDAPPCGRAQRLEVQTGLYNRATGVRVAVLEPASPGDRIHAGWIRLVSSGSAAGGRAVAPADMRGEGVLTLVRPWYGWLSALGGALLLTLLLTWALRRRRLELPEPSSWDPAQAARARLVRLAIAAILAVPMIVNILLTLDFIKDDAYISFRYAQQFVRGEGLVFNAGERLEGITNLLWTLLMIPFEALGLDLFVVSEVLGTALCVGLLIYMMRIARHLEGTDRGLTFLWGGLWVATSSSVGLWSTSGMEQALAMFLPVASAFYLWRTWNDPEPAEGRRRDGLKSGVLMGLGCMTRPEIHLIGFFVGLPMVIRCLKARRLDPTTVGWFIGLFAITVPGHLFRLIYFGDLVPNTFYVKTSDSALVMIAGLRKLHEMFAFNDLGVLVVLLPFAFVGGRRHLTEKLVMLAVAVSFMGYIVKVGVDEMQWHRLYLPALPFLAMLAAWGLRNLCHLIAAHLARPHLRAIVYGAAWAAVLAAGLSSLSFSHRETGGFNGRGDLSGNFHPDMGKFVTRHDRPGALVAFQDMGSTPYHAPDIDWLDFIGLVDRTVARARYRYGLHAFLATEAQRHRPAFDAEMREYFYERNPEWTILTTYIPAGQTARVAEAFAREPVPASLGPAVRTNSYQFGIYNRDFEERYVHVRTWPRSAGYYLSLFRRRDLWEQIPGEVVLDAVPDDLSGPSARLSGGLELLGAELEGEATRKHEFFLTTWWRVPGPMEPDIYFFHHVERPDFRLPYDAIPGDWMYPADRWRPGDIIENRVLVQLPPHMRTGTYDVFIGVYRRSTGERFAIESGPDDGQSRVHLGQVRVTPLIPPFDHLIKPTRVDEQRKHPERIVDHGRHGRRP